MTIQMWLRKMRLYETVLLTLRWGIYIMIKQKATKQNQK